jgi:signal transduction histidine kinase
VVQALHYSKDITARKRLEKQLTEQNAKLLLIQEIGESMHSSDKLDELLEKILNSILKLGFNRAALYLNSISENKLKGVMSIGFKNDVVKDISLPITEGRNNLISQVFEKKEPIFVKNIFDPNNRFYVPDEWLKAFEGNSILVIPLIIENNVIGILTVDMRDKEMRFDESNLNLLELFANDAAIAISRSTLNEKLKNFNERLKQKIRDATAELSLKNRRLEELDRMKNQFLSTISHELKTPLTSIKGYSSLMSTGKLGNLTDEQKKSIDIVNNEAERLNQLITNLLDLTKLETGRLKLKLQETDLNQLVESVVNDMKTKAAERNILFKFTSAPIGKIKLDPNLIELALKNLISNAIIYNKPDGSVEVLVQEEESKVVVYVKDTGKGMNRKEIKQIFAKFHQLQEHTIRYTGGAGIGLAIVKSIIDKHNGNVKIKSSPRKGTTISFSIPKNLIVEAEEEEGYQLRRTVDELKSIRSIFNIMHSEKSLKEILKLILEEIHKTIGFDRIRVYLLDKKSKVLRGVVAIGSPDIEKVVANIKEIKNFKLIKSMLENKQAEIIELPEKNPMTQKFALSGRIAAMPLIVKGDVIGVIAADNLLSKKEITDEDLKSLTIFANSAAISIENFRLYQETDKKVKDRTYDLVKANKQKDEFLSYVGHELRTPLTSLLGYSKLLLTKKMDKKTAKDSIKIIYTESERLKSMINNLLDLSKIEAGKIKLDKARADLVDIAKNVRRVMKKQAEEKDLGLEVVAEKIPIIMCDKDKIQQVLLNLVSNGIKFTKKGHVKIILTDNKDCIQTEVQDTGIGIAQKDYKKVFSKFVQIKNDVKTAKGTGLGMPITKQIIDLHRGKIWIKSRPKQGTSFFFTLPKS